MSGNQKERHELSGIRAYIGYLPIHGGPVDFLTLIPHREGVPGMLPPIFAVFGTTKTRGKTTPWNQNESAFWPCKVSMISTTP